VAVRFSNRITADAGSDTGLWLATYPVRARQPTSIGDEMERESGKMD
jgi:hypothetical protein